MAAQQFAGSNSCSQDWSHAWKAWPAGARQLRKNGSRRTTGGPRRLQVTQVPLRARRHGTRSPCNSGVMAIGQQTPWNSGRDQQQMRSRRPLRHGGNLRKYRWRPHLGPRSTHGPNLIPGRLARPGLHRYSRRGL